jgi:hypothetical protein
MRPCPKATGSRPESPSMLSHPPRSEPARFVRVGAGTGRLIRTAVAGFDGGTGSTLDDLDHHVVSSLMVLIGYLFHRPTGRRGMGLVRADAASPRHDASLPECELRGCHESSAQPTMRPWPPSLRQHARSDTGRSHRRKVLAWALREPANGLPAHRTERRDRPIPCGCRGALAD